MKTRWLVISFLLLLVAGCSGPLPADKLAYVGEWQSKEMRLLILADGTVACKRLQGGGTTSINAPLKEFVGDDFVVGVFFLTTIFEVTEPPHEVDEGWQVVVDGIRLTRTME